VSDRTRIAWTQATWNPTTGCDRVSPGCDHCYAAVLAKRLKAMGSPKYQGDGHPATSGPGFAVTVHPDALQVTYRWKQPRTVFVDSMSDLFHPRVPTDFVRQVFTVESADQLHRIRDVRAVPAVVRFVSAEPLLGPLLPGLDLTGIDWVITGGESGPAARPVDPDWVRAIRDHCQHTGTAFFHKQWGGPRPRAVGRLLDGATWDQTPPTTRSFNDRVKPRRVP
jgi:protein gp37